MTFGADLAGDLRLAILQVLAADDVGEQNAPVLRAHLERYGHRVGRGRLADEAAWLEGERLVSLGVVGSRTLKLRITSRGEDVAAGRATVAGVARPDP